MMRGIFQGDDALLLIIVAAGFMFAIFAFCVRMLADNFTNSGAMNEDEGSEGRAVQTWGMVIVASALCLAIGIGVPVVVALSSLNVGFIELLIFQLVPMGAVFHFCFRTGLGWGAISGFILGLVSNGALIVGTMLLGFLWLGIHPGAAVLVSGLGAAYPFLQWRNERMFARMADESV